MKQILPRVKRYFKENLGVPFIIVFQVLLLICAGLLIIGNAELANGVATGAYFLLVIGVFLQLVSFIRLGKEGDCD